MKRTSSYTRLGCETYASTSSVKTSPSLEFRTPPNTDHCERNEYVKRPAEKLIYNLIYDIVLAPILAATRTILSLSLNLMTIFALSAGSMRLFYELYNTIIDDKKTTLIFADRKLFCITKLQSNNVAFSFNINNTTALLLFLTKISIIFLRIFCKFIIDNYWFNKHLSRPRYTIINRFGILIYICYDGVVILVIH